LIAEFDKEAELANLEKAIKGPAYSPAPPLPILFAMGFIADLGRARYVGHKASSYLFHSINPKQGRKLNYSLYAHFCSDTETVKQHLDSGVLAKMLAKKETAPLTKKNSATTHAGPGYEFVLLVLVPCP
jgi:hypothetical protein